MKKIKIKVCGLTLYDDIYFCLNNNVDYIGLNFYSKSKRYITPEKALSIFSKIDIKSSSAKTVGVFVDFSPETIISITKSLNLDYVQLHSDEDVSFCKYLKNKGLKIIKVFRISNTDDLKNISEFYDAAEYFLFDKKSENNYGGTGESINPEIFNNFNIPKEFFLAGGLSIENIPLMAKKIRPYCIDINSKFELSAGVKDHKKINFLLSQKYIYY